MKPLIGITCNYDYRETVGLCSGMGISGQDWNFVSGDYVYYVEKAGGIPVLIPQCEDFGDVKQLLGHLDGVLISGGHDVGPEQYNTFTKGYCGTIMPMRDAQDISLTRYMTFERDKPVLGICRGIEIMNVAFGGTLYQDLEKDGGFEHHFGDKYPRNIAWHKVSLSQESLLASIYQADEIAVNSFHHQAVWQPGENVRITAHSSDGVPEGIELTGHKFVVGVQWHPEMMFDSAEQLKLMSAFVTACRS